MLEALILKHVYFFLIQYNLNMTYIFYTKQFINLQEILRFKSTINTFSLDERNIVNFLCLTVMYTL